MDSKCYFDEKLNDQIPSQTISRRRQKQLHQHELQCYYGWRDISTVSASCATSELPPVTGKGSARLGLSDFATAEGIHVIGVGGFGIVRCVQKRTGADRGVMYALKSMSKEAILTRTSGPAAVAAELHALMAVRGGPFVSQIQYAFQDEKHLFLVLELAEGGDMRCNLRARASGRFSEEETHNYTAQLLLALDHCHRQSVLHRGMIQQNSLLLIPCFAQSP